MAIFDTLSQETRLKALLALVDAGPAGMAAGALSETLGTPHNTLSFHLAHMANTGIVTSRREGRSIIYTVDFEVIGGLVRYLVRDCCSREVARIRDDGRGDRAVIELMKCC